MVHCDLFVATDSFGLLPIASVGGSEVHYGVLGHRASRHQVAGDARWRHLLSGSEVMRWIARSRFERALLELDRDRSGRQTGSGAYRVGTAGGIGVEESESLSPLQCQSNFHKSNCNLQLGPNSEIPIPHWDPYRNINSPIGAQYQ